MLTLNELVGEYWLCDDTLNQYIEMLSGLLLHGTSTLIFNPLIVQAMKSNESINMFLDPIIVKDMDCIS